MSGTIAAFITDADFINNNPFTTSSVFELSSKGFSFSKDKLNYSLPAYPGNDLIVFRSVNDQTNAPLPIDNSILENVFQITALIKTYPDNHIVPYDHTQYRSDLEAIGPQTISDIRIGPFEVFAGKEYPAWFSFVTQDVSPVTVTIYLSDNNFVNNYPYYEVQVVPYLATASAFNGSYVDVLASVNNTTVTTFNDRLETAKAGYPPTHTKVLDFWYHNKVNPTQKTRVYWGIVIYGEAGNDIDVVKDELEAYILSDANNIRAEWEVMFPDIFSRTEFLLVPLWHKVAIENLSTLSNLYSSMVSSKETINFIRDNYSDIYTEMEVYSNLVTFPYDHKAITIAAMAGALNASDRDELFEIYPDYIPVNTSSLDYMRMSPETRDWMTKLQQALIIAETDNPNATVPSGFRKVTRAGNKKYVAFFIGSINYLVAFRFNTMYN